MWISRVRVSGGFLAGLDVALTSGLNVVIGARGSGKTTLIELIRHALGTPHAGQSDPTERQRFISEVLESGEVVLDIETDDGVQHLVVDAKGAGRRKSLALEFVALGQSEIEGIASDSSSRLNLIDMRLGTVPTLSVPGAASGWTTRMHELRQARDLLREQSARRDVLMRDRNLLASREALLLGGTASELTILRDQLKELDRSTLDKNQRISSIERARSELAELAAGLHEARQKLVTLIELVRPEFEHASLADPGNSITGLAASLQTEIEDLEHGLESHEQRLQESVDSQRQIAAPIRSQLEEAEADLGQITAQIRNLDVELRELEDSDRRAADLDAALDLMMGARSALLDEHEQAQEDMFARRSEVAKTLSSNIADDLLVAVEHLADSHEFRLFLQRELKGTNTRAATIASVANKVLPRVLLELVEAGDSAGLATLAGLTLEQATRIIAHLDTPELLSGLAEVQLKDRVDFRLHDGATLKGVEQLSTGQKVAVTLPIVLSEPQRSLLLDQPEDHLDNAYLVKHIVKQMENRTVKGAQTLVATHNPNIPVLGSATTVLALSSDGISGYVDRVGPYDEPKIVERITTLMEGGRDAFALRAKFYADHGGL
jgi:ABC-type lipoprotein export system ATPase subunit